MNEEQKNISPHARTAATPAQWQPYVLLTAGLLLLLALPLCALAFDWRWDAAANNPSFLYAAYFISSSAHAFIAIFFCLLIVAYLRLTPKKTIALVFIMAAIVLGGAAVKRLMKDVSQEPRPYAVWLEENHFISSKDFYALPNKTQFIQTQDFSSTKVSPWQQQYWSENTSYSFPSGHSLFAASWVLLVLVLMSKKKSAFSILCSSLVMLWGIGVLASRLYLGMHWPQDLILSSLLAFILVVIGHMAWQKWVFSDVQYTRTKHDEHK